MRQPHSNEEMVQRIREASGIRRDYQRLMRVWRVFVLLCCAGYIVFARVRTAQEPLDVDLGTYMVVGHQLAGGDRLYTDLWDHKPPAVHLTYALFILFCGYGRAAIVALSVCFTVLSMLLLEGVTRRLANQRCSLLAAVIWAFASGDIFLQGNQPNCEVMMNTMALAMLFCFLKAGPGSIRWPLLAGFFAAIGSLYKMNGVFLPVPLAVWVLSRGLRGRRVWPAAGQVGLMALPGAVLWAAAGGYFMLAGRFGDFRDAVFTYNREYAHSVAVNLLRFLLPENLFLNRAYTAIVPLAVLSLLWFWVCLWRERTDGQKALALFGVGSALVVAAPGRYFPHYYLHLLPFFCMTATMAWLRILDEHTDPNTSPGRTLMRWGLGILPGLVIAFNVSYLTLKPTAVSKIKYGSAFVDGERIAGDLGRRLAPTDTLYQFGRHPALYFYLNRRCEAPYLYNFPLHGEGAAERRRQARLMRALTEHTPDAFVYDGSFLFPALDKWLAEGYEGEPLGEGFILYRHKRPGAAPLTGP